MHALCAMCIVLFAAQTSTTECALLLSAFGLLRSFIKDSERWKYCLYVKINSIVLSSKDLLLKALINGNNERERVKKLTGVCECHRMRRMENRVGKCECYWYAIRGKNAITKFWVTRTINLPNKWLNTTLELLTMKQYNYTQRRKASKLTIF